MKRAEERGEHRNDGSGAEGGRTDGPRHRGTWSTEAKKAKNSRTLFSETQNQFGTWSSKGFPGPSDIQEFQPWMPLRNEQLTFTEYLVSARSSARFCDRILVSQRLNFLADGHMASEVAELRLEP